MPTALSTDQRQMCTNQSSQRQMTKNKIVLHYFKPWNLSDFCVVYLWVVQNQKLQLFYIILLLQPKSNLGSYSTSATRRVRHSQTNSMQNMLNYLPSLHLQLKLILLTCNKLFRRNGFPMLNIDLPASHCQEQSRYKVSKTIHSHRTKWQHFLLEEKFLCDVTMVYDMVRRLGQ